MVAAGPAAVPEPPGTAGFEGNMLELSVARGARDPVRVAYYKSARTLQHWVYKRTVTNGDTTDMKFVQYEYPPTAERFPGTISHETLPR